MGVDGIWGFHWKALLTRNDVVTHRVSLIVIIRIICGEVTPCNGVECGHTRVNRKVIIVMVKIKKNIFARVSD